MTDIIITVPGPPVPKGRGRVARLPSGVPIVYTPDKTRRYEALVRAAASDAMDGRPPLDEALSASIIAVLPVPASWSRRKQAAALRGDIRPTSRPDADNFAKAALDGCAGVVFRDDALIVDLCVSKVYGLTAEMAICIGTLTQPTAMERQ